ncbi:MAG: SUMF1/EgtB/PvdO family nonheme iron enzyme [Fibrobacterota bacterium]
MTSKTAVLSVFCLLVLITAFWGCSNPFKSDDDVDDTGYVIAVESGGGEVIRIPHKDEYQKGDTVLLIAREKDGYQFLSWKGDTNTTADSLEIIVTSDKSYVAQFGMYALNLQHEENRLVYKKPDKELYGEGDTVLIVAIDAGRYSFAGWSGDIEEASQVAEVIMDSEKNIQANFTEQFILSLGSSPGGSVSADPEGMIFSRGDEVRLSAAPQEGYTFWGWSGDIEGDDEIVDIVMDGSKNITANFKPDDAGSYSVNVEYDHGRVIKYPDNEYYKEGAEIELVALDMGGYSFVEWGGDAEGVQNPLSVTVDGDMTISATFLKSCILSVYVSSGGSVTRSPARSVFFEGEEVVLHAQPSQKYLFSRWEGDLSGRENPLSIEMNDNISVAAIFAPKPDGFVYVPGGDFRRGSEFFFDENPVRTIAVSSFYIRKYPVTQAQYREVMGINPSFRKGDSLPVEGVTWYDAVRYCNKKSASEGRELVYDTTTWTADFSAGGYRLPTEAEWEFALRAGSKSEYFWGNDTSFAVVDSHAVFSKNSLDLGADHPDFGTWAVGEKNPNGIGVYDMAGNVWEWCHDWYDRDYYEVSTAFNPRGPDAGTDRVRRGGSWNSSVIGLRSANRNSFDPSSRTDVLGFRPVLSLE